MNRNALREELAALLTVPEALRPPVIRRSLKKEWLYAADLSMLYGGKLPDSAAERLSAAGWEVAFEENWLQLRKAAPEPPENWYAGPFGPEAGCCASLLRRHPGGGDPAPETADLIRAAEEGPEAYEAACAQIHRSWAEKLRRGESLPAISVRYFEK